MLTPMIAFGIFVTVVLLFEGVFYFVHSRSRGVRDEQRVKERLQSWTERPDLNKTPDLIVKETYSEIPWLNALLAKLRERQYAARLANLHDQAKVPYSLAVYVLGSALLAVFGGLLGSRAIIGQPFIMLGCAGAGMVMPWGHLYYSKWRRLGEIQRQLPDALELIGRALRAGHALFVGMKMVGSEMRDPIAGEFQRGFDEISMGVSVPESLSHMADRVELMDVKFFVTSVNIQRETGGNLAEIVDSLGRLIRKRFELKKKVRALSADGRISALVLMSLPFGMAMIFYFINPEYLMPLFTDPMGQTMVAGAAIMMILGGIVMKKMIAIKV
ncbi:MAG TPA: type II secretion system F family protein [Nitrospiraceae bacterium]|nr:type II secretion system F family protein [Nitrospiraceae bacterium]